MIKFAAPLFVLAACAAQAQTLKIPASFDKLAAKANNVVDIKLDANMLRMGFKPHSGKESHSAVEVNNEGKLKGGFVRSYEFEQEGEYSQADVEAVRSQLRGPGWSCVVNVRSKKNRENTQVCFYTENGKPAGMAIVATEPKELTIVTIAGAIDPEHLGALEGQFGIPKLDLDSKQKKQDKQDD